MVGQSSTETVLPESEIFLLEHDLHYRNITKELSLGNALVGISLMLLILLVGIGVAMLYHLAFFMRMQLYKFHQDIILLLAKAVPLNTQNFIEHFSEVFEVMLGSVSWLQPLDFPGQVQEASL